MRALFSSLLYWWLQKLQKQKQKWSQKHLEKKVSGCGFSPAQSRSLARSHVRRNVDGKRASQEAASQSEASSLCQRRVVVHTHIRTYIRGIIIGALAQREDDARSRLKRGKKQKKTKKVSQSGRGSCRRKREKLRCSTYKDGSYSACKDRRKTNEQEEEARISRS